jgi:hypothetical protein
VTGADAVLAADGDFDRGEAAFTVGCHARNLADAVLMLDILGLAGAVHRWDEARAGRLVVSRCRHCRFTVPLVRSLLPRRAGDLAGPAVAMLRKAGLAARAGNVLAGEQGRVAAWKLTPAGCDLSDLLRAGPGASPSAWAGWLLYDGN